VLDFILPKGVDVPDALLPNIHPHHVYPNSRWRTILVSKSIDCAAVMTLLDAIREQRCLQGSFADTDAIGDAV
jgi:hypothetical protein